MARPLRCDGPGVWHHVMNRGIARRTVFEDARDIRYFLSRLARAARARWIEVHAYCVLSTHFHLLVRSSDAGLSLAMGRVLNDYVRWFNRGRRRDGPLFRGRFRSRPVASLEYRRRLVRYIDANPVFAGLVPAPALYPHGSAYGNARHRGPLWLDRSWIEAEVRAEKCELEYNPRRYLALFADPPSLALARVIERRIESGARGPDPLADGTCIDLPICDPEDVSALVAAERARRSDWLVQSSSSSRDPWQLLEVGLLRELCGSAWTEIGSRVQLSDQSAMRAHRHHVRALDESADYASAASRLASVAIARCYGSRGPLQATASHA